MASVVMADPEIKLCDQKDLAGTCVTNKIVLDECHQVSAGFARSTQGSSLVVCSTAPSSTCNLTSRLENVLRDLLLILIIAAWHGGRFHYLHSL